MKGVVLDMGPAALIGAALRLEKRPLCEHERLILLARLSRLAASGDQAAALVVLRMGRCRS